MQKPPFMIIGMGYYPNAAVGEKHNSVYETTTTFRMRGRWADVRQSKFED